jgi:hypothetical protein
MPNIYKQIHDISIKIRHCYNKTERTQLKQQLAELTAQLPEGYREEDITE